MTDFKVFFVIAVIALQTVSICVLAWYLCKHGELLVNQARLNNQLLARIEAIESRNAVMDRWAGSFGEFAGDMNKRLVSLETDNKDLTSKPQRDDEDPFTNSRSWTAQAAAAERGARVGMNA